MKLTNSFKFNSALLALALTAGMAASGLADKEKQSRGPLNQGTIEATDCDDAERMDADDFTTRIDNPYFPLVPGTTYIYEGTKEGSPLKDVFMVTHRTKMVMGVRCREILDRSYVDGVLEEETLDWFAQDEDGNVWYFGEAAKELDEDGNVISTEGSWEAGVDDALPGIVMEAHPRVGDTYQQEIAPGVAEDMATVLAVRERVKVPLGTFRSCLKTKDFSALDPDVVEQKFYAPGVGFIRSVMVEGGKERLELVRILHD